jgi:diamine N-acetyltransferase
MSKDVRLEDVTAQNWRAVVSLKLAEGQQRLLASNAYSIAQSKFDEAAQPRAIYAGDKVVGFLMYDVPEVDDEDQSVSIYRFMVDKKHQGKGYGRAALTKAIEEIRQIPGIDKVTISYVHGNAAAKKFYASFGFVELPSKDGDWELVAELKL